MVYILIGLVSCLGLVFFQDLKYRKIHVILPILLFLLSLKSFYSKQGLNYIVYITNILFFLMIILILVIYMSVKNKQFLNPFTHYFGLGDLLFFIAISPLFVTYNYILFFIISMLFSIVLQSIFKKVLKDKTVPLAGFSALLLLLVIAKDLVFSFNKLTLL